ncbi:hypothetical protein B9Z19DRAFT_971370, partial [Tuber borchii]
SLYRRSLKLSLDWSIRRDVWRPQALNIRELFEANRDIKEPRQLRVILQEAEETLERWKHPDPYRAPTAPGGSKYERNIPPPMIDRMPTPNLINEDKSILTLRSPCPSTLSKHGISVEPGWARLYVSYIQQTNSC